MAGRVSWVSGAALVVLGSAIGAHAQTTYEYDAHGRLTKVTRDDGSIAEYAYDEADNRTQVLEAVADHPVFTVDDVEVSEGGNLSFTVTKIGETSLSHAVDCVASNGDAETGDYTATSGTLTFTSVQDSKPVVVPTVQDGVDEFDETVLLTLSSPTNGAVLGDDQGVGSILDDDAGPVFSVDDDSVSEGGTLSFTITKTGATEKDHVVYYETEPDTATIADFTHVDTSVTFTPADATKTATVSTTGDSSYENDETLFLNLTDATNGASIGVGQGVGTILNDDPYDPGIQNPTIQTYGSATINISLSQLALMNGHPGEIISFTLPGGCGSRTIAGDGQSVSHTAPQYMHPYCSDPKPTIECTTPYVIEDTSTSTTYNGTATINIDSVQGSPPPMGCP